MGLEIALIAVGILIALCGLASMAVSIWLSFKYAKYNRYANSSGLSGEQIARKILDDHDLYHIKVSVVGSFMFGNSYSHYFGKVRLRRFTKNKESLTSLGMGAQKSCLALLDAEGDPDMAKRIRLVPLITFGPFAFIPLIVIGVLLDLFIFNGTGLFTVILGILGFLFYVYSIVLCVMTLKTEKKAQQRAYEILRRDNIITEEELSGLQELFRLYNIQYINDIVLSVLELIYRVLQIAIKSKKIKN